jgi:urea carboxylase-associated protein 2
MSTATVAAAMAHARAQASNAADAMPTLPAADATDRPGDVAPEAMLWAETIAAGGYAARILPRGARLKLIDSAGDGCIAMLMFSAARPAERLNVADTMKVQWNAYLREGRLLLSDMGKVLATIIADDCEGHDAICGASNEASNRLRYGQGENWSAFPNARDRFKLGVTKFGLAPRDIHPCMTWFKPVTIDSDGHANIDPGPFRPGRAVTLRIEQDVIVVLANCPHVLDPRGAYSVTPVRVIGWSGPATPPDDAYRNATPEGLRAFLNLEADLA